MTVPLKLKLLRRSVLKGALVPRSSLKGKASTKFPADVNAVSPIVIDEVGGDFTFSIDIGALEDMLPSGDVPSTRTLTAGAGLTGGGDLSADRTFDVVVAGGGGILVGADAIGLDSTDTRNSNHAAISVDAGNGLTGGGFITASIALNVGGGSGIVVNADDVALNIAGLTEDTTPDLANDFLASYDTSAVAHKKVRLNAVGGAGGGGRPTLTANRTYYVRKDGSDANNGLADTAGGAYLTVQKALNTAITLDFAGFNVTIQVRVGTYVEALSLAVPVFGGLLTLTGDTTTPANVIIAPSPGGGALTVLNFAVLNVSGIKVQSNGWYGMLAKDGGVIKMVGNCEFGACSVAGFSAENQAVFAVMSNYRHTGGGSYAMLAQWGGLVTNYGSGYTVTQVGTLAFTAYSVASRGGLLFMQSMAYSGGTVTGARYLSEMNAVIFTNSSANPNYFPGSAAGASTLGGQYS